MKIVEYNAHTGEYHEREATPEEMKELQQIGKAKNIPQIITARQLRLALLEKGVDINKIDKIINALPEEQKTVAQISWEYAHTFERNNPMLLQVAEAIGITEEELNDIFIKGNLL